MKKVKRAQESEVTMTELVLPNDTNTLQNLMGGKMMHMMDIVSAISAQKHCNRIVVTASVDSVSFAKPIKLGNVVTLYAKVTRAFNSSMEVYIEVFAEDLQTETRVKSNEAFFTFVAVDQSGNPIDVPELIAETEVEHEMYLGAMKRRQIRLVLAGRMQAKDADQLQSWLKN